MSASVRSLNLYMACYIVRYSVDFFFFLEEILIKRRRSNKGWIIQKYKPRFAVEVNSRNTKGWHKSQKKDYQGLKGGYNSTWMPKRVSIILINNPPLKNTTTHPLIDLFPRAFHIVENSTIPFLPNVPANSTRKEISNILGPPSKSCLEIRLLKFAWKTHRMPKQERKKC